MDLLKYVTQRQATSLLLKGSPGMSMLEDGLALARHLLKTSDLDGHPDFLMVAPMAKKKTIGVEEIMPIISLGAYPPVHGSRSIAIIDGMDKLTVAAQNKLLILLETNPYVFVIGVCYGDVIDTVKSRMRIIPYHPYTKSEFLCKSGLPEEEGELFYYATAGCIGFISTLKGERDLFKALKVACGSDTKRKDLYSILRLVKEKDKQAVTEDPFLQQAVLRVLIFLFQKQSEYAYSAKDFEKAARYNDIVIRLIADERLSERSTYSKNDFFTTIMYCVEH